MPENDEVGFRGNSKDDAIILYPRRQPETASTTRCGPPNWNAPPNDYGWCSVWRLHNASRTCTTQHRMRATHMQINTSMMLAVDGARLHERAHRLARLRYYAQNITAHYARNWFCILQLREIRLSIGIICRFHLLCCCCCCLKQTVSGNNSWHGFVRVSFTARWARNRVHGKCRASTHHGRIDEWQSARSYHVNA